MKEETTILAETCAVLARQRLPRWRELPDLDLYMDQILSLVKMMNFQFLSSNLQTF